jgi:hypothetical protein
MALFNVGSNNFLAGDSPGNGAQNPYASGSFATAPPPKMQPVPIYKQGTQTSGYQGPTFDQTNAEYMKDLGRPETQTEYNNYWNSANYGGTPADWQTNWQQTIANSPEAQQYAKSGVAQYGGTNVFSDPATQPYESFLNNLINRFNTPYTPPDYQNTIDSLKGYISRLQGPAYTPEQMGLLQTQVTDPLTQQRDQSRQQIINQFASRGMSPDSGPVQQALLQNEQNYQRLTTQARAGVANQAIGLQNQNQANAAALQAQLPGFETNLNSYNLGNASQAAQLAGIVPALAQSRLNGAGASTLNPQSLIQLLMQGQQTGLNNGANYASQLQSVLPYILPLFGL